MKKTCKIGLHALKGKTKKLYSHFQEDWGDGCWLGGEDVLVLGGQSEGRGRHFPM